MKKRERGEDPIEDGANDIILKRPNPLPPNVPKPFWFCWERNFMGFIYAMKFLSNWERNLGFKYLSDWEREREISWGLCQNRFGFVGVKKKKKWPRDFLLFKFWKYISCIPCFEIIFQFQLKLWNYVLKTLFHNFYVLIKESGYHEMWSNNCVLR